MTWFVERKPCRKKIEEKRKKTTESIADSKNSHTFATHLGNTSVTTNGSLDEWLSQRSAKPCTAVRIRQEPQSMKVG